MRNVTDVFVKTNTCVAGLGWTTQPLIIDRKSIINLSVLTLDVAGAYSKWALNISEPNSDWAWVYIEIEFGPCAGHRPELAVFGDLQVWAVGRVVWEIEEIWRIRFG